MAGMVPVSCALVAALALPLRQPAAPRAPEAGTAVYRVRMEAGGATVTSIEKSIVVREERGLWIVTERARMPAGDTIDEVELARESLMTRKRSISQGPLRMVATFDGTRGRGSVIVGATQKPFDVEIGGPILGDGPAAWVVLGALPLAVGYTVALRTFDMFALAPGVRHAGVVGIETVTVPAGTFKVFRVRVEPERGVEQENFWIAVDSRRVVKATATIPEAGAVMIAELGK